MMELPENILFKSDGYNTLYYVGYIKYFIQYNYIFKKYSAIGLSGAIFSLTLAVLNSVPYDNRMYYLNKYFERFLFHEITANRWYNNTILHHIVICLKEIQPNFDKIKDIFEYYVPESSMRFCKYTLKKYTFSSWNECIEHVSQFYKLHNNIVYNTIPISYYNEDDVFEEYLWCSTTNEKEHDEIISPSNHIRSLRYYYVCPSVYIIQEWINISYKDIKNILTNYNHSIQPHYSIR